MAKERELECPGCHIIFKTTHGSQKYCSKDCYKALKSHESKKHKKKNNASAELNKIVAAALAEGLTYGQYVALHNL